MVCGRLAAACWRAACRCAERRNAACRRAASWRADCRPAGVRPVACELSACSVSACSRLSRALLCCLFLGDCAQRGAVRSRSPLPATLLRCHRWCWIGSKPHCNNHGEQGRSRLVRLRCGRATTALSLPRAVLSARPRWIAVDSADLAGGAGPQPLLVAESDRGCQVGAGGGRCSPGAVARARQACCRARGASRDTCAVGWRLRCASRDVALRHRGMQLARRRSGMSRNVAHNTWRVHGAARALCGAR